MTGFPAGFRLVATLGCTSYPVMCDTLEQALEERARFELYGFVVSDPLPVYGPDNVVSLHAKPKEPKT